MTRRTYPTHDDNDKNIIQLKKVTKEIQNATMQLWTEKIKGLLINMKRVVRDTAKGLNKNINTIELFPASNSAKKYYKNRGFTENNLFLAVTRDEFKKKNKTILDKKNILSRGE